MMSCVMIMMTCVMIMMTCVMSMRAHCVMYMCELLSYYMPEIRFLRKTKCRHTGNGWKYFLTLQS